MAKKRGKTFAQKIEESIKFNKSGKKKKNEPRYSAKDFFIDAGLSILGLVPSFLWGMIQVGLSLEPSMIISLAIAFTVFFILKKYRLSAGLFFGIINLNVIMIVWALYDILYRKKR